MTTRLASIWSTRVAYIDRQSDGVHLKINTDATSIPALKVDRAEFLAAVATELDVIIINRAHLPEFSQDERGSLVDGTRLGRVTASAESLRADAYRYLAMADYFEKNPPVDEAQVEALTNLLWGQSGDASQIARRLVQAGVRAPQETP